MRENIQLDMYLRAGRAMSTLLDLIKDAYNTRIGKNPEGVYVGFTASSGSGGAIGALNYEVRKAEKFIEGTIGLSDSARYLRNLEYGERGTQSAPQGGALFSRQLAPPLKAILDWLKRSAIQVPQYFKELALKHKGTKSDKPWASDDENVLFAYAIAQKRKRLGRAGMHVIERTIAAHTATIMNLLAGGTA